MNKLQLENQELRRELLEIRTEQEQATRVKKRVPKGGSSLKADDPCLEYEAPAHVIGLMSNPWVTRNLLQRPCPSIDPSSLARYDDDEARADGELSELYHSFPEHLRPGIRQHNDVRARVSMQTHTSMFDTKLDYRFSTSSVPSGRRS